MLVYLAYLLLKVTILISGQIWFNRYLVPDLWWRCPTVAATPCLENIGTHVLLYEAAKSLHAIDILKLAHYQIFDAL